MAGIIAEKPNSRETTVGDRDDVRLLYVITDTSNDLEVFELLDAEAPSSYLGLVRQFVTFQTSGNAANIWEGIARYGRIQKNRPTGVATGGDGVNFDTGGGTQHITHSKATINTYAPAGETAPNNHGAIGATRDSVEGVDITVPVYNFSETHTFTKTKFSDYQKDLLFRMTGTVNGFRFRFFDIGECLFLGASGALRDQSSWEITFRFSSMPNVPGLVIGNITVIQKLGGVYRGFRSVDDVDFFIKTIKKKATGVYIEQVYDYSDFSLLDIG